jgi:hypothetical protein
MALEVEGVVDGGVDAKKRCAEPADLKRCIFRRRRRTTWCEFSARLFIRSPCSWRQVRRRARNAAA